MNQAKDTQALYALLIAESIIEWKEPGDKVRETAIRAARKIEDEFFRERIAYHLGGK